MGQMRCCYEFSPLLYDPFWSQILKIAQICFLSNIISIVGSIPESERSLGGGMATHSVFLPGKSVDYSPWGCKSVGHDLTTKQQIYIYIYIYIYVCVCVYVSPSVKSLFADSRTVAHQVLLSMEFSRQEYWSLPRTFGPAWLDLRALVSIIYRARTNSLQPDLYWAFISGLGASFPSSEFSLSLSF